MDRPGKILVCNTLFAVKFYFEDLPKIDPKLINKICLNKWDILLLLYHLYKATSGERVMCFIYLIFYWVSKFIK